MMRSYNVYFWEGTRRAVAEVSAVDPARAITAAMDALGAARPEEYDWLCQCILAGRFAVKIWE